VEQKARKKGGKWATLRFTFFLAKPIPSTIRASEPDAIAVEGVKEIKKVEEVREMLVEFFADQFAGSGIEHIFEVKLEDGCQKGFRCINANTRKNLAHKRMDDDVGPTRNANGKLVGKEIGSETGGVDSSNVTTEKTTLAISKGDRAEFLGMVSKILVKRHEIVGSESCAKVGWELITEDNGEKILEEIPTGLRRVMGCRFVGNVEEKIRGVGKKTGSFTTGARSERCREFVKMEHMERW
jgi:hypothetical protein